MNRNDFLNKLYQESQSFGNVESSKIDANRGAIAEFTRSFPEVLELFKEFKDEILKELLAEFPRGTKEITKYIEELSKKQKIDQKEVESVKQKIELQNKQIEGSKKYLAEQYNILQENVKFLSAQKAIFQNHYQIQRNNIEQLERGVLRPLQNALKTSSIATYVSQFGSSTTKAYGDILKSFVGNATAVNKTILANFANQFETSIVNASQEFTKEFLGSAIKIPKEFYKGFKEGREKYYERQKQKISNKEAENVEKFEDAIHRFNAMSEIAENKWLLMSKYGMEVFRKVNKEDTGGLLSGGKGTDMLLSGNDKLDKQLTEGIKNKLSAKIGGMVSGITSAVTTIIPIIGGLFSSAFDKMNEVLSTLTQSLADIKKEKRDFEVSLYFDLGSGKKQADELFDSYQKLFLGKGLPIFLDNIKESYEGLIEVYGGVDRLSKEQVIYATEFEKIYKIGGQEFALFSRMLNETIGKSSNYINTFRLNVDKFAKKEGISSRDLMRDLAKNTQWIALVGSKKMTEEFTKSSAQLRSMGLHAENFVKLVDSFQNFDQTTESIFKLNAALGTQIDPMRLHIMAMMGDAAGIQKLVLDNLDVSKDFNAIQVRQLSETLGLTFEEVRALEHGLKVRKELGDMTSTQNQNLKNMILGQEEINKLKSAGFSTDEDQLSIMQKRMYEVYEQHKGAGKGEFSNLADFISALRDPKSEVGKSMKKEIEESILQTKKQESMEDLLKDQLTIEEQLKKDQQTQASAMQTELKAMNSGQQKLNDLTAQILSWFVGVGTKLAVGLLDFFGLDDLATIVGNVGNSMSKMAIDANEMVKKNQQRMGLIFDDNDETKFSYGGRTATWKQGMHEINNFAETFKASPAQHLINQINPLSDSKNDEYTQKKNKGKYNAVENNINNALSSGDQDSILRENIRGHIMNFAIENQDDINDALTNHNKSVLSYTFQRIIDELKKDVWLKSNLKGHPELSSIVYDQFEKGHPSDEQMDMIKYIIDGMTKKANGGMIYGPGGPKDDKILAKLSNKEFVVNAESTEKNRSLLELINNSRMKIPGFVNGGNFGYSKENLEQLKKAQSEQMEEMFSPDSKSSTNAIISNYKKNKRKNSYSKKSDIGSGENTIGDKIFGTEGNAEASVFNYLGDQASSLSDFLLNIIPKGLNGISNMVGTKPMFGEFAVEDWYRKNVRASNYDKNLSNSINSGMTPFLLMKGLSDIKSIHKAESIGELMESGIGGKHILESLKFEQDKNNEDYFKGRKNGGLVGSFANGTMPDSNIPGFINTNDFSQIKTHPNESVQVMNNKERISRDAVLEKLISMLSNGFTSKTELKIDEQKFGDLITKILFMETQ